MTAPAPRSSRIPPPDFKGLPAIAPEGLSFVAVNEDGTETMAITLARLPGAQQLRAELIAALAEMNGPRRRWRSIHTVRSGYNTVSVFLRWIDREGHEISCAAELTAALWKSWLIFNGNARTAEGEGNIYRLRSLLECIPTVSGAVTQVMRKRVGGRESHVQESYTEDEYRRIRRSARKTVHAAYRRINSNYHALLQLQKELLTDGTDVERAQALREVLVFGKPQSVESYRRLGAYKASQTRILTARSTLFASPRETWACAVLLAAETGWNRSVIDRMKLPDNSIGAGDVTDVYTVELHKPRRGTKQHSTTTVLGSSDAGRALTWILGITEPAREVLGQDDTANRLLIYSKVKNYSDDSRFAYGIPRDKSVLHASLWAVRDLAPVSLRKLRRTRQVLFDRTPTQNSRAVHENVYLRNDRASLEEAHDVAVAGITDAVNRAEHFVQMQILAEEDVPSEMREGMDDTAIGACSDFEHHPVSGVTCTDPLLACLGCSNAVATPRHLPRLVLAHAGLSELSSAVGTEDWQARWQIHYERLCTILDRHTTEAERSEAMRRASDVDRAIVTRLLNGGYSVQ